MKGYILAALALCLLLASASADKPSKGKVLVLLDSLEMQGTHSKFLAMLEQKGYDSTVVSVDAKTVKLKEWDRWLFDKLVILGGKTSECHESCMHKLKIAVVGLPLPTSRYPCCRVGRRPEAVPDPGLLQLRP